MGSETYHHLKKVIHSKFGLDATAVGDEGGFAPNILNNKDGIVILISVVSRQIKKASPFCYLGPPSYLL